MVSVVEFVSEAITTLLCFVGADSFLLEMTSSLSRDLEVLQILGVLELLAVLVNEFGGIGR